jgi:hypothetical protein
MVQEALLASFMVYNINLCGCNVVNYGFWSSIRMANFFRRSCIKIQICLFVVNGNSCLEFFLHAYVVEDGEETKKESHANFVLQQEQVQ